MIEIIKKYYKIIQYIWYENKFNIYILNVYVEIIYLHEDFIFFLIVTRII